MPKDRFFKHCSDGVGKNVGPSGVFLFYALIRPHSDNTVALMGEKHRRNTLFQAINKDARHWQILALSGLFAISFTTSDFGAQPLSLALALSGALIAQTLGTLYINYRQKGTWNLAAWQWKSAVITSLSLSILLRASSPWLWFAAGLIGIALKFMVRYRGKHIFNPACIGIVCLMLVFDKAAWVSPGQWGQAPLLVGYALALAGLVLSSAKRLDIALGFLGTYAAILFARALWLGDPLTIPMHHLSSGALLVFAFFMITDPRSTPDSRLGRLLFSACVAGLAAWFVIGPNIRGAPLMALACLALLTPILDRFLPAKRFVWTSKETHHDPQPAQRVRARPRFLRA